MSTAGRWISAGHRIEAGFVDQAVGEQLFASPGIEKGGIGEGVAQFLRDVAGVIVLAMAGHAQTRRVDHL